MFSSSNVLSVNGKIFAMLVKDKLVVKPRPVRPTTLQTTMDTTMPSNNPIDTSFRSAYRELEARMKARAEADGDVFLPNPEPSGPVDYIFTCMEPSLGGWVRSRDADRVKAEAEAKIEAGFRNFVFLDRGTLALHSSIRQYLCEPTQRYYVTDLSKGAMLVERAQEDRRRRYSWWYELLLEELDILSRPRAQLFAVGNDVKDELMRRDFPRPFTLLLHYSPQTIPHRKARIAGHEVAFDEFKRSLSVDRVLTAGKEVMAESLPAIFRDAKLAWLTRLRLSESDLQLIFIYKRAFEAAHHLHIA
jgi:hypothetical protein